MSSVAEIEHELVREAMLMTGVDHGVEITTLADIPSAGSGLGSSSAVTVGLLPRSSRTPGRQVPGEELAGRGLRDRDRTVRKADREAGSVHCGARRHPRSPLRARRRCGRQGPRRSGPTAACAPGADHALLHRRHPRARTPSSAEQRANVGIDAAAARPLARPRGSRGRALVRGRHRRGRHGAARKLGREAHARGRGLERSIDLASHGRSTRARPARRSPGPAAAASSSSSARSSTSASCAARSPTCVSSRSSSTGWVRASC